MHDAEKVRMDGLFRDMLRAFLNVYGGAARERPPQSFAGFEHANLSASTRFPTKPAKELCCNSPGAWSDPARLALPDYSGRYPIEGRRVEFEETQENQTLTGSAGPPAREMQGKEPEGLGRIWGALGPELAEPKLFGVVC